MTKEKARIGRIRYNLEFSGYEAIVTIEELGRMFSYPSFVRAPLDAEYELVMQRLSQSALAKHRSNVPGLRSELRRVIPAEMTSEPPLAA